MRAIDRAVRWSQMLEQVGFTVTVEEDTFNGLGEYKVIAATKDHTVVEFVIRMDTKYTRFVTGSVLHCGSVSFRVNQPNKMASLVSSEVQTAWYRAGNTPEGGIA